MIRSWKRAATLGFLMWLVPFVVAFIAFPFRATVRPLFESIMAVTVTGTAVFLGLRYIAKIERTDVSEGLVIGLVWLAISVIIDAPLMLIGGPMRMSLSEYFADIALTYVSIPLVTLGLAIANTGKRHS